MAIIIVYDNDVTLCLFNSVSSFMEGRVALLVFCYMYCITYQHGISLPTLIMLFVVRLVRPSEMKLDIALLATQCRLSIVLILLWLLLPSPSPPTALQTTDVFNMGVNRRVHKKRRFYLHYRLNSWWLLSKGSQRNAFYWQKDLGQQKLQNRTFIKSFHDFVVFASQIPG